MNEKSLWLPRKNILECSQMLNFTGRNEREGSGRSLLLTPFLVGFLMIFHFPYSATSATDFESEVECKCGCGHY